MTTQELRQHKEYKESKAKIESYPQGFKWTMKWLQIPTPQRNALKILLSDCIKEGLIKSVSIGYGLDNGLVETEETFERI